MRSLIGTMLMTLFIGHAAALAQPSNRQTMVMDDGEQRRVLHYSEPNLDMVVQPEFTRSDVELFVRELQLSDAQRDVVIRAIEDYLEAFAELKRAQHPDPDERDDQGERKRRRPGGKGDGGGQVARMDADPVRDILLEELRNAGLDINSIDDLPVSPEFSIGVMMGAPGEDGEPPEPEIAASLTFEGEDDALTPELREKLKQAADKAVPRITEHIREDMKERMGNGEFALRPIAPGEDPLAERWAQVQALRERIEDFLEARARLRQELFLAVQTVLAEPQLERWPKFLRTLTRVKTLPWGEYDGEQTNLIAIARDVELPGNARSKIGSLLQSYELELHEALERRNELLAGIDGKIDLAVREGDEAKAISLVDRITRARMNVRRINDQYTQMLADQLGGEAGKIFRAEALATSYPTVYRQTTGQKAIGEALALDGLSAETIVAIEEMRTAHALELQSINERIVHLLRDQQPKALRESVERVFKLMAGEPDPEMEPSEVRMAIAAGFRDRQQLDVRTMKSIYSLLTERQVAKLPRIPDVDVAEPVTSGGFGWELAPPDEQ
jgi:hypothetical protein